ncbi:MAG: hypothetical protein GQE15_19220 [Archangiaceae bacterium]|nr:hypothetical protein [Archangiaceae bacterium]
MSSSDAVEAVLLWGFRVEQPGSPAVEVVRLDAVCDGECVAIGHGVPFEAKTSSALLGVVLARFETELHEELPGMSLALDLADAGEAGALPGIAVTAAALRAGKKRLAPVKQAALERAAAQGLKVFDVDKPRAFLLVRGLGAATVIVGEERFTTTFEGDPKVVPATSDLSLCAWGHSGS